MFIQPKSETNDPVLRIAAEFVTEDGTTLSSQTQAFQAWQLRSEPPGRYEPIGQSATEQPVFRAFLHAKLKSADAPQPIVEMRWEASRPDEVGLRLATRAENDRIRKWRLRILDGTKHLWREMHVGDRVIKADRFVSVERLSSIAYETFETIVRHLSRVTFDIYCRNDPSASSCF